MKHYMLFAGLAISGIVASVFSGEKSTERAECPEGEYCVYQLNSSSQPYYGPHLYETCTGEADVLPGQFVVFKTYKITQGGVYKGRNVMAQIYNDTVSPPQPIAWRWITKKIEPCADCESPWVSGEGKLDLAEP